MRSGGLALGLGAALCLVAGGFGITALYLPGTALLLMAAAAAAYVHLAARGAAVMRALAGSAVEEQASLPVTLSVLRPGPPISRAEVRAWPGGPTLPLRGSDEITTGARFPRRGRHRLGPASLLIADPLGLCGRKIDSGADEVLVLPRIEPVRSPDLEVSGGGLGGRPSAAAADALASEVDGIQPHQPGTPASRIHWPAVARTALLMERRLARDADQAPLVVVDPCAPSSEEALDQAMRAAASLCVHLARRGGCTLLLPGDRRVLHLDSKLSGFEQAHVRLAVLGPDAGAPPVGRATAAGAVLWVSAASGRPRLLEALRTPLRYVVSPHPIRRWPIQFTVAGCSGQRLGRRTGLGRGDASRTTELVAGMGQP